jgi:exosome complex component RRP42
VRRPISRVFECTNQHPHSSQSAYANHTSAAIDDLSADLSTLLQSTLSTTLTPSPQLTIVPNLKSWLLTLDAVIISDSGNIVDTLFIAARAALWDTRIPRTRSVEFQSREEGNLEKGDVFKDAVSTGKMSAAVDFELMDYWDDGEPLVGREAIPVCITLNLVRLFLSYSRSL